MVVWRTLWQQGSTHRRAVLSIKRAAKLSVTHSYLRRARNAAGSTSGSSISVDVVAMPPLNMASNTALPTARANLRRATGPDCKYGHWRIKYGCILAETNALVYINRAGEFAISLVYCNIQNDSNNDSSKTYKQTAFHPYLCAGMRCTPIPFPTKKWTSLSTSLLNKNANLSFTVLFVACQL